MKIITIDKVLLYMSDTPSYCRDDEDRVRFLAWKQGLIDKICPGDPILSIPENNSYELYVKE